MKNILIAFVRGINVGNAKRVSMAALRALMEELGYTDVHTLLNSGNVVFRASRAGTKEAARLIPAALSTRLGVSARVMVLSAEELADIVKNNPLGDVADNPSRMLVGILGDHADCQKLDHVARADWKAERITVTKTRTVYMWMPDGVIASKLNAAVSKAIGEEITSRNWATMIKLNAMAEGLG
jgi:uncharacterized protein (DUF1697 family)